MKLTSKIKQAITAASVLHLGQKRKADGLPYIIHPYSVAFILANYTDDEDVIVAGLLHDVLEDVPGYEANDLTRDFGERVCKIVREVSEDKSPDDSKEKDIATWQARKEQYIANLRNDSQEALLVSCADKIHNLISIVDAHKVQGEELWKNFNAPKDKIVWYHGEILKVMEERLQNEIVLELSAIFKEAQKIF